MSIGENIRKLRKDRKITLKELGSNIGLSEQAIGQYERGDRTPNIETIKKIAEFLNVSVEMLTSEKSFDREIFNRAMQLALKNLYPDNDVFMVLGLFADYDTLLSFYNNNTSFLPLDCIKGLLDYIAQNSPNEFSKIYNDLVSTDIYNLDSDLEDYCQKLYIGTMDPLDFMADDDKEALESLGWIKDGKLSIDIKNLQIENNKNVLFLENGFITLSSIKTPFMCKEYIANLINYRIKDFDFNSLSNEDFDAILRDTLDFIEFEVHKIKSIKNK